MLTSSTKREIRQFHLVVVQRRQGKLIKPLLENFSIDDGDSSENVTSLERERKFGRRLFTFSKKK